MVLRRCRRMLREEHDALDALHDVFARLIRSDLEEVEFPSTYLYTTATRICLDRIRSARVRGHADDSLIAEIASADDLEETSSRRRLLDRIFRRHEESTKVIAVLHYVDGMGLEEVAEQTGLSVSGVRRRLDRLKRLSAPLRNRIRQIEGERPETEPARLA